MVLQPQIYTNISNYINMLTLFNTIKDISFIFNCFYCESLSIVIVTTVNNLEVGRGCMYVCLID